MDPHHERRALLECRAEQLLTREHGRLDERAALWGEDSVALLHLDPAQQDGGIDQRQQVADVQVELPSHPVQVHPASPLGDDLEKAGQRADSRVRQRRGDHAGLRLGRFTGDLPRLALAELGDGERSTTVAEVFSPRLRRTPLQS